MECCERGDALDSVLRIVKAIENESWQSGLFAVSFFRGVACDDNLEAVGDGFACGFGIPRMTAEAVIVVSGNACRLGWRMDS